MITTTDVQKIAELAKLELAPGEAEALRSQLASILSYVLKLDELDTSGIEPMSHCKALREDRECVWREDVVRPCLGQETALANAPDADAGYFRVPKVIGG